MGCLVSSDIGRWRYWVLHSIGNGAIIVGLNLPAGPFQLNLVATTTKALGIDDNELAQEDLKCMIGMGSNGMRNNATSTGGSDMGGSICWIDWGFFVAFWLVIGLVLICICNICCGRFKRREMAADPEFDMALDVQGLFTPAECKR